MCVPFVLHSRSVWTVSSHFEYLENWLCDLGVTWQPVRGDFTTRAWTVTLPWGKSVSSEMPLSELVYCVTITFKMADRVDQWICIKFCFKLGHSSTDTIQMIKKAFGYDSMSEAQIKLWYWCFKDGREYVESNPHSGRPSTSGKPVNVEHMRAVINENRWLTVRELEDDLGISRTIVSEILMEDLDKKRGSKICSAAPATWTEGISCWSCTGHAWNHLTTYKDPDFLKKGHNWKWVMGLWLWPWNKCPFFPLGFAWVSTSKEGVEKLEKRQGHVDGFIYIYIMKVVSTKSTFHQARKELRSLHQSPSPADGCSKKKTATAVSKWWLATSSWQCTCPCCSSSAGFFGKTSHHPVLSAPLQPRFGSLWLLAFPKAKIVVEREEISDHGWR